MITEYHRPKTIDEAVQLLKKANVRPLGGGTVLNQPSEDLFAVVDLQALGLDKIHKVGEKLEIGATATLQSLVESAHTPEALKKAIKLEAPLNRRNMGTAAGALVACDGRSPFLSTMLALDAKLILFPNDEHITLGNLLPLCTELLHSKLILKIEIPLNLQLAYEYVARTPADKPIVCAALAKWPSGRTRLVIGGWGRMPSVAMDGVILPEDGFSSMELAARNAAHDASDEWAGAEYRSDIAAVLATRCMDAILSQ